MCEDLHYANNLYIISVLVNVLPKQALLIYMTEIHYLFTGEILNKGQICRIKN